MKLESLGLSLLVACTASSCGEERRASGAELAPVAVRATRQEVRSSNKVLILSSSVNGGIDSREAQAALAYAPPGVVIDVVTPTQWRAMTATQFMSYSALIIGDAGCTAGETAFQAAIDTRATWGAIVDGDLVLISTNVSSNNAPQIVENAIRHVILNTTQYRTGMYISLGCAYQNAPANTHVALLEPFGEFKVQGLSTCAEFGHIWQMSPDSLSRDMWDGLIVGDDACVARSVITSYPSNTFSFVAIAQDSNGDPFPGEQVYPDYFVDESGEASFVGTPYIVMQGAMPLSAGCGNQYTPSDEQCDLDIGGNGIPASPGEEPWGTCSFTCRNEWCGDGHVDAIFGEECDEGILNGRSSDTTGTIGTCTKYCKIPNIPPPPSSPPVALCKNVTVLATNTCGVHADINNGSSDPDNDLVGCTQNPPSPYSISPTGAASHNTTVTLTCTDQAGNTAQCSGVVTVTDKVVPTVTLNGLASQTLECNRSISYSDPGATGNDMCSGPLPSVRSGSVSMGMPNTYTVNYTATDQAGNRGTAMRTVIVSDTLPPTITVGGTNPIQHECGAAYNDVNVSVTDQCTGSLSVVRTGTVNTGVPASYTILYNATDTVGNVAQEKSRTVNVRDALQPTVTISGSLTQTVECNDPAYVDPGATATDQCAGALPAVAQTPPNTGVPGTYPVRYQATDPAGNVGVSSNTRTVTVSDTLPPMLALQGANPQALECGTPWADPGSTASDQCAGPLTATVSGGVNHQVPAAYTVTYTAFDGTHTLSANRAVNVSDTLPPAITVNGPLEDSFQCGSTYTDPGASATDACDGPVAVTSSRTGDSSRPGTVTISYSAQDAAGHQVTSPVTRTVTVDDDAPPTLALVGPAMQRLECATAYTDPGATADDACFGNITPSIVRTGSVNNMQLGAQTLTYNVADGAGNSATPVSRTVNVEDGLAPVVTVIGPLNLPVECGDGTYTDPGASASDSCAGNLPAVPTTVADPNAPGSYVINYQATDPSGNVGSSSTGRTVTVSDTLAPVLSLNGGDMGLECASPFNDPGATANDQCLGNITGLIARTGTVDNMALGPQTLTYTVSDGTRTDSKNRTVTVSDTVGPAITVNGPLQDSYACGSTYTDPGASATDACAGPLTVSSSRTGDPSRPGTVTISYWAVDPSNNRTDSPVTRQVTVNDEAPPTLALLGPGTQTLECGTPYTEPGFRASDVCAGDLTSVVIPTGAVNSSVPGDYTIRYTVADLANHTAMTTRQVRVADTKPPSITCPGPIVVETLEGTSATVQPGAATATDACAMGQISGPTEKSFPMGTTDVTYTATDAAGNQASCTSTITVVAIMVPGSPLDRALLGGGGCSSTGDSPSSLAMVGLGVLAVLWVRRRTGAGLPVLVVLLVGARAFAQPQGVPTFELELLRLNPSGTGSLLLGAGELPSDGDYRFSLTTHYENDPLVLFQNGTEVGVVVRHRATAHLAASYGLWGWLELGAQVPVLLLQRGDELTGQGIGKPEGGLSPGTPLITLRLKLLAQREEDPVDLSLGVHAGPTVGSGEALAREPRAIPSLMVGRRFSRLRAALDAGILLRPRTILSQDENIQDELGHALRLGGTLATLGKRLRGELAVLVSVPLRREGSAIETLAGARWPVSDSLEAYGLAGLGFGDAPGTPDFRLLLGVAYGRTRPVPVEVARSEPTPEPKDMDGDGLVDGVDQCPVAAGPPELQGCPDQDGDGLADEVDRCPSEPGPVERQGCPAKDSDGDTLLDEVDACPTEPGIPEMHGCPARDTDKDTVQDHLDNCPEEAGPPDNQGCPAEVEQLVAIQTDRIAIKDTVHFDFDKATIQARSFPLLDQVARILLEHPEILSVTIEGHTDDRGSAEYNRSLSQRRVEAVRDYLAQKTVAPERMEARGFGEDRPVLSNATDEGRAANRRVEFITRYTQAGP